MKSLVTIFAYVALAIVAGVILRSYFMAEAIPQENEVVAAGSLPEQHRVSANMLAAAKQSEGRSASPFQAPTEDGSIRTLSDFTLSQPLVMVFIKDGCPCSVAAQPFFNRLHDLYGAGVQFAGIIDDDAASAHRWVEANSVPFPLVLDPKLEIVHRYGVESSVYVVLIGRGGKVLKTWPGYSADMLRDLGYELANMTKMPQRILSLNTAPREMYAGCPY